MFPMDTLQVTRILRSNPLTSRSFKECIPIDHLREPSTFPSSYVVNLDSSDEEGSHWVVYYFLRKNNVLYFDSFARPPTLNINVQRNIKPYQSIDANTCPHHCISFIYHISIGFSLNQYCRLLNSQNNPDLFVKQFVRNLLNK